MALQIKKRESILGSLGIAQPQATPQLTVQPTHIQAPAPVASPPQFDLGGVIRGVGDFTAGANEAFLGGITRGAVNTANLIGSGFNQQLADQRTNDFLRATGQINAQGNAPATMFANRNSNPFMAGQAIGQAEKLATEGATAIIPGVAVERGLAAAPLLARVIPGANAGARAVRGAVPLLGGSLASSAVFQAQDPTQDPTTNFGINAGLSLAGPVISGGIRGVKEVSNLLKSQPGRALEAGFAKIPGERGLNHYTSPEAAIILRKGAQFDPTKAPIHGMGSLTTGNISGKLVSDNGPAIYLSRDDKVWGMATIPNKDPEIVNIDNITPKQMEEGYFQKNGITPQFDYKSQKYVGYKDAFTSQKLTPVKYHVAPDARKLVIDSPEKLKQIERSVGVTAESPSFWSKIRRQYDVVDISNVNRFKGTDGPGAKFFRMAKADQSIVLNTTKVSLSERGRPKVTLKTTKAPEPFTSSLQAQKYPTFQAFYKDYKPFFDQNALSASQAKQLYTVAKKAPVVSSGVKSDRPSSAAQTQFEQAYNSGDVAGARQFANAIKDPASKRAALQAIGDIPATARVSAKEITNPAVKKMIAAAQARKLGTVSGGQERGFTQGIKRSPNYSPKLQEKVKSSYIPFTNNVALAANEQFAKKGLEEANKEAISVLSDPRAHIGKQEIVNYGKTLQALDAKGRIDEANAIHDLLAKRLTEGGQRSQAAALLYQRTPEGLRNMAYRDLRNAKVNMIPKLKEEIDNQVAVIKGLPEGEARDFANAVLQKIVSKQLPQDKLGQIISIWKAGLLSGVKTQGGNFASNATFGALKRASDPGAVLVDRALSLLTGKRSKTFTLTGTGRGISEGARKGVTTLETGIDLRTIDKYENHAELNFKNPILNNLIAKPSNLVFRGMSAADQPFWYATLKNSLYDQAKADGINLGLRGRALRNHMDDVVHNPTKQMVAVAEAEANKSTLAYDTLGFKAVQGLHQGIDNSGFSTVGKNSAHAAINVLAPFTKVPTAFLSRTVDFTPLGPIKELLSQISKKQFNQRQLAQAISEGATGTGMLALGIELAKNGMLSGEYPKNDAKEQSRWRTEHITPNSVKIDGNWVSLNYMGPLGLLFNAGNQINEAEKGGADVYNTAGAAIAGLGQGLLGQSFLQGFSGFSDAVKDPAQSWEKWVHSQAGSVVPNIINDIGNVTDPMQRQINSTPDAVQARLPILREQLPAKVDAFGNDLTSNSSGLTSLNPLRPSSEISTSLLDELNRLGSTGKENAVFPTPDRSIGSGKNLVRLNPEQVTRRQKMVGARIQPLWNAIIASPAYINLDDAHKAVVLKSALADVNSVVNQTLLSEIDPSKTGDSTAIVRTVDEYLAKGLPKVKIMKAKTATKKVSTKTAGSTSRRSARPKLNPYQYSVSLRAGGSAPRIKVGKVGTRSPRSGKIASRSSSGKPRVSIKKSLV